MTFPKRPGTPAKGARSSAKARPRVPGAFAHRTLTSDSDPPTAAELAQLPIAAFSPRNSTPRMRALLSAAKRKRFAELLSPAEVGA